MYPSLSSLWIKTSNFIALCELPKKGIVSPSENVVYLKIAINFPLLFMMLQKLLHVCTHIKTLHWYILPVFDFNINGINTFLWLAFFSLNIKLLDSSILMSLAIICFLWYKCQNIFILSPNDEIFSFQLYYYKYAAMHILMHASWRPCVKEVLYI